MKLYTGDYFAFFLKTPQRQLEIPLAGPTPLRSILTDLQIPLGEVYLVVVNGKLVALEAAVVSNEDEVKIHPPMDGG